MNEKCPLEGMRKESGNEELGIPEVCYENCEELWQEAGANTDSEIDAFDTECTHEPEYDHMSLERRQGAARAVTHLYVSKIDDRELFSESYRFNCPNN